MPTFTPKSDTELNAERLLEIAEYDFSIIKAEDKKSKTTGAVMIALTVGVYTGEGDRQQLVNDFLVFTDKAMFKVSQFCKATGLYALYKAGNLSARDCHGRVGRCKVGIEPERDGYPAKNKITSYVIPKEVTSGAASDGPPLREPDFIPDAANSEKMPWD